MDQPVLPYPAGQAANALVDDGPFGFFPDMECQSVPEMISADQSPSGPLSALDIDEPAAWSGPGHTPPASDHRDHSSFRPSTDLLEAVPSHESVSDIACPFLKVITRCSIDREHRGRRGSHSETRPCQW